jgi:hypothetical protein
VLGGSGRRNLSAAGGQVTQVLLLIESTDGCSLKDDRMPSMRRDAQMPTIARFDAVGTSLTGEMEANDQEQETLTPVAVW